MKFCVSKLALNVKKEDSTAGNRAVFFRSIVNAPP